VLIEDQLSLRMQDVQRAAAAGCRREQPTSSRKGGEEKGAKAPPPAEHSSRGGLSRDGEELGRSRSGPASQGVWMMSCFVRDRDSWIQGGGFYFYFYFRDKKKERKGDRFFIHAERERRKVLVSTTMSNSRTPIVFPNVSNFYSPIEVSSCYILLGEAVYWCFLRQC
jgi:hypothetical protein